MAKRKAVPESTETVDVENYDFFAELTGELTKDKLFEFSEYDNTQIKASTGFEVLDAIIAGSEDSKGLQLRTFNTFYGNSGSGKSTLLLQIAYNIVKNNNGKIIFIDAEQTMYPERITKLGIDMSKVALIKQDLSVENFYQLLKRTARIRNKEKEMFGEAYIMENPTIIIVDSFTALASAKESEVEDYNSAMGVTARAHSAYLKTHIGLLFKYNITVFGILQPRDNIQIGPTPKAKDLLHMKNDTVLGGGKAIPFYSFYLCQLRSKKVIDESYGVSGMEVEVKFVKSKSSASNKPVTLMFLDVTGYSNLLTNYKILLDNKVITAAGAYKKLPGYDKNWYTRDLEKLYTTDEEFRVAFDKALDENLRSCIDSIPEPVVIETINGASFDQSFDELLTDNIE